MPKGLLLIQQLYSGKITLSFENGVENFEDLINAVEKYRKLACYEETLAESSDISQNYNEENFAQDIAINDSHNKQIVDSDDLLNQNTDT
ncbi:14904_t:CDS:2 [Gigaspora rosea]|nr:14904_t:CDS:2 [Gigaspora rosea]